MRDQLRYMPVNWVDGMKINKTHFIAQDNAQRNALQDISGIYLSPDRYGLLPPDSSASENYQIKVSADNQRMVHVAIHQCQAITIGGARIAIPAEGTIHQAGQYPVTETRLEQTGGDSGWWIVLLVNPYDRVAAGVADVEETPPRLAITIPTYTVHLVSQTQHRQYLNNPYALTIGKILANGNEIRVDEEYIPPCFSIAAHADLQGLLQEIDRFLANLESRCATIVQKIYKKSQQNDLSELVLFLCDRMMLYLAPAIVQLRWQMLHQSPAMLFAALAALARVMKNTIDLRIGSGREEMMNYLSEWCELNQGELESMLTSVAGLRYLHYDVNSHIPGIVRFVKVTDRLFETLSKLDFIGKRKESGIFVKEERPEVQEAAKSRRRFFG